MRTAQELRSQARDCLELAARASDDVARISLRELAQRLNRDARQAERRERDFAACSPTSPRGRG
jgi:hypothetical protein